MRTPKARNPRSAATASSIWLGVSETGAARARTGSGGFAQAFNAAKAAPGLPGQPALSLLELPTAIRRQPHSQFDAVETRDDIEAFDFGRVMDDGFGEAEADREVAQIARRRHQHCSRGSVMD
jgi:hypothetical protein